MPLDRLLVETDAPYLTPQPVRRKERNRPAYVVRHRRASSPSAAGSPTRSSTRPSRRPPPGCSGGEPASCPRSRACAACASSAIRPEPRPRPELPDRLEPARRHRAGGRSRRRATSCSRSAAGSACSPSTSPSARRTSTSSSSTGGSRRRCATRSTRTRTSRCTSPTRSGWTSRALDPAPTKVVANLPYGVAATVILRTIEELPSVTRWVAMVQREVGERLAAAAGTPAYGAPSVLAQLACDVRVLRPVSRTVFHPVPERRLGARRARAPRPRAAAASCARSCQRRLRAPPQGAAALARPRAGRRRPGVRDRARAALEAIGRPADARAEALSPAEWVALHARDARPSRGETRSIALAPGKVNLCLFVGAPRADGLHPLVSRRPAGVARRRAAARAGAARDAAPTRSSAPASTGRTSPPTRSPPTARATGWDAPPQRLTIDKRVPVAAGMGGGSGDAAAALRLAAHAAGRPGDPVLHELAAAPRRRRARRSSRRRGASRDRRGRARRAAAPTPAPFGAARSCPSEDALSTPAVYREADRLGLGRRAERAPGRTAGPRDGRRACPPSCCTTTSRPPPARSRPSIGAALDAVRAAGADHAMVSGSGPTVFGLFAGRRRPARARAPPPRPAAGRDRRRARRPGLRPAAPRAGREAAPARRRPLAIAVSGSSAAAGSGRPRARRRAPSSPSRALLVGLRRRPSPRTSRSSSSDVGRTARPVHLRRWSARSPSSRPARSSASSRPARPRCWSAAWSRARGRSDPVLLIALVWACAVAGDLTSYTLGRRLGRGFLLRHGAAAEDHRGAARAGRGVLRRAAAA